MKRPILRLKKPMDALRLPYGKQTLSQDHITAIAHYNAKWQRNYRVSGLHGRVWNITRFTNVPL